MAKERSLLPRDVRWVLEWAEKRKVIPTQKKIAHDLGVSEATVARIVKNGGYLPPRKRADIEALARSFDRKISVPRESQSESKENFDSIAGG